MTQQEIKRAISGISELLGSNPEMMSQQLTMLKALIPNIDDVTIHRILEKTKAPDFDKDQLEAELQEVVTAIKSASQRKS